MDSTLCIEARGLRKSYGRKAALDGLDLSIPQGRIVGLIGRNGAGKTTALMAMLGLVPCEGDLRVLGLDPWRERDALVREAFFVADVASMPRWLRVRDALDYVDAVHPRFDRAKAEEMLAETEVRDTARIRSLSRGMAAQLHLALALAIDARLLVLDEPTLGLDIVHRKRFYDALRGWFAEGERTIVITTHHAEEVQDVLTDVVFIDQGRVVLERSMDELGAQSLADLFVATVG